MKALLKLAACWTAFVVALIGSGLLVRFLNLRPIVVPDKTPIQTQFVLQLGAGALLVLGLYPLARRLAGSFLARACAVGGFVLLALGVNGIIETRFFTHFMDTGVPAAAVFYICLAMAMGATMGFFFGVPDGAAGFNRRGWPAWAGRGIAVWIGWPLIYFFFGMCVAPIVVPYYSAGIGGLRIPPMDTVLEVQLVRSLFFLASSLPFIALWKGSRRGLWLALGLAHAFTVGIYGLAGATFLPSVLRITHAIEITCDSFAYAGLLVLLLAAPSASESATETKIAEPHARAV